MKEGSPESFVGRDEERARLATAFDADRSIAVIGEAGIGKTTFVRAAAAAAGRGLFEGGGFATLRALPLLALRRAMGVPLSGEDATVARLIERRVGPDLLFVDDLHWTDAATARVLRLLRGRIGIIVAIRSGDAGTDASVALARDMDMDLLALTGLDRELARSIVTGVRPALAPADVERIVARAGGNPLVLQEVAARGKPSFVLARSIHAGLDHLSTAGRGLLEVLAILDRPVDRRLLGDAVGEAVGAGFLLDRGGQVEIRHVLIAEAIRGSLTDAERRDLHERAAAIAAEPDEVARHLARAGLAARAATTAAAALASVDDPIVRADLLVVIAEATPPTSGLAPRLAAGAALSAVSDWQGVVRLLEPADGTGAPEELAQRDALLAHATFSLGRHDAARAYLDRATTIELEPGSPASGRLAIERAAFMVNVEGRLLEAIEQLSASMADHPTDTAGHHAIRTIVESMRMLAVLPVDIDYLRGAVDGALAAGQYATAADLARVVTFALLIWEGAAPAVTYADEIGARLASAGAPGAAIECRAEAIQGSVLAGRPAEAVARADELLELPAPPRARQTAVIFRARALGLMGLLDDATAGLAELEPAVTDDFVGRGELVSAQADLALWGGLTGRAIELAAAVQRTPSPARGAYTLPQLTRAWAQLGAGLEPEAVDDIIAAPTQAGAPFEVEGLRLLHAGDGASAAARFAEAAAHWAGFNAPRELVCRWAAGEALRRAGHTAAAIDRLEDALAAATACGIEAVSIRIRRSLRQAGRRLPSADPTPRITGVGLTRREREVVDLAGQGLTNAEIARRMGLGRPTVTRILSNAMAKLGAESRGQAVRLVSELG